jgi:uncharacterized cupin superfamily protein
VSFQPRKKFNKECIFKQTTFSYKTTDKKEEAMPETFNTRKMEFKNNKFPLPEFEWLTSGRLAKRAQSKYLEFDIRSLSPAKFSFPYHFHRAAEELFLIISGEATLRTPKGFQKIAQGDLIFFEEGPSGAHQLYNHSHAPCVYLDIRTTLGLDVCEYPDSGKVNILPTLEVFEKSSKTDYFKGEEAVRDQWPEQILKASE